MDQQIFRRTAIAKSGPEVDLKPAHSAKLLHASQFRFALPQRDRREIVLCHVTANHEHAADTIILIDRAIAVGPVNLLQSAIARHRNELVLVPGRAATAHHLLDLRPDNGPDFSPALATTLT